MLSTQLKLLSISLLTVTIAVANIVPTQRVTEPDQVRQHQLVQEEIYKNMNQLALPDFGTDSVTYMVPKTVYTQYNYSSFTPLFTMRSDWGASFYVTTKTKNSFTVYSNAAGTVIFDWAVIGTRN